MKYWSRVIQTLLIVLIVNSVAVSLYFSVDGLIHGSGVPVYWRIMAGLGVVAFVLGLVYVIIDRLRASRSETFRKEKW